MDVTFWTLLLASEWAIRVTMLPVIVLRKERPATCLAWLTIVFFEPWVGLGLYLLIGENRLGRRRWARRRSRRLQLEAAEYPPLDPDHIVAVDQSDDQSVAADPAARAGGLPVAAGNSIVLMNDTDVVIDRLIADINAARQHVHLLFYIFKDDSVGWRVAEALARASQRGVACRVLADGVGSRQLFRRLAPWLRQHGVRIFALLPATLWRLPFARLDLRNHRKLAVIDGLIAFTGSQNIVEASYGHKRAGVWHDIMARITGPVVRQLQGIFLEDWFYESGELLEDGALFPAQPGRRADRRAGGPHRAGPSHRTVSGLDRQGDLSGPAAGGDYLALFRPQRGDGAGAAAGRLARRARRGGDSQAGAIIAWSRLRGPSIAII